MAIVIVIKLGEFKRNDLCPCLISLSFKVQLSILLHICESQNPAPWDIFYKHEGEKDAGSQWSAMTANGLIAWKLAGPLVAYGGLCAWGQL